MKKILLSMSLFAAVFAAVTLTSMETKALDTVVVGQPYYGGYGAYGYGPGYGGYGYGAPYAGYVGYPGPYAGYIPVGGPGYYPANPVLQRPYSAGNPFYLYNQTQRVQAGKRPYFPANPVNDYYY